MGCLKTVHNFRGCLGTVHNFRGASGLSIILEGPRDCP
ncbi:unnamed protein product [Staurois parvus]|uniref:Uncharacterized protein n=1 Tax=Staurois parvus TaxID=386267 RepID=A0ABN9AJI4_9NEOB|nr:unnamed protein product [Staurois parvus]